MKQRGIRSLTGLLITVMAVVLAWQGLKPALSQRFELDLYDLRLQYSQLHEVDPRIVIVDIDEKSLAAEGRWPWGRERVAQLVRQLTDHYEVALVGFDISFPEPDQQVSAEQLLQQFDQSSQANLTREGLRTLLNKVAPDHELAAVIENRPVVLGYLFDHSRQQLDVGALPAPAMADTGKATMTQVPEASGYIGNLAQLQSATPWAGFFDNPLVDIDGIYRRVPILQRYDQGYYTSLSLSVFMALMGELTVEPIFEHDATGELSALTAVQVGAVPVPLDKQGSLLVPYRGPMGSFPYISATDVLTGKADKQQLDGTLVLVGTSAAGLLDLRSTPLQNRYPGVEVHANLLSAMLDERFLVQPDYTDALELIQLLLTGVLLSLVMPRLSALWASVLALGWAGVLTGINLYAWQHLGWVMPLGFSLQLLITLYLLEQTSGYFFETRNRHRLAAQFGQYIPLAVVERLNAEGAQVELNGESRMMTVFFSDVRGFTGLSEKLTPTQLTRLMNIYLTHITDIIYAHHGTVDKYIGDAVMAFWGAPLNDPDHALWALDAALAMDKEMPKINQDLAAAGLPAIDAGMGLNTGLMNVGNMGSRYRMAYTVMGDAVNLGSRLEGLTKYYGVPIIVSSDTADQVECYSFMALDRVQVKGRAEPVTLYQPLGRTADLDARTVALAERFNGAMRAFQQQDWSELERRLVSLSRDGFNPSLIELYRERLTLYRQTPPPVNWDGVFVHTSK